MDSVQKCMGPYSKIISVAVQGHQYFLFLLQFFMTCYSKDCRGWAANNQKYSSEKAEARKLYFLLVDFVHLHFILLNILISSRLFTAYRSFAAP